MTQAPPPLPPRPSTSERVFLLPARAPWPSTRAHWAVLAASGLAIVLGSLTCGPAEGDELAQTKARVAHLEHQLRSALARIDNLESASGASEVDRLQSAVRDLDSEQDELSDRVDALEDARHR